MVEPVLDAHPRPAAPLAADPTVALLRWPEQDGERRRLVARGEPRILVISQYSVPPGLIDDLEMWVLDGAGPGEVLGAVEALRRRARSRRARPVLDGDGLLWFGGRWVAVPDTQLPVVGLLVDNLDRVVRHEVLHAAYSRGGGSTKPATFRTVVRRLGQRVGEVGLGLHVVRRRGAMLAAAPRTRS
jgi:hypothetical protein